MKKRHHLAKLAIASLVLASATPTNGETAEFNESLHQLYAVKCAEHGCPAKTPNTAGKLADNSDTQRLKRKESQNSNKETNRPIDEDDFLAFEDRALSSPSTANSTHPNNYNSYNTNRNYNTSPGYIETTPPGQNSNQGMSSPGSYKQLSTPSTMNQSNDASSNNRMMATTPSSRRFTEAQLLGMLSPQARSIYLNLDNEGRSLAIQLGSQDSYADKDLAVKEAQRKMNERKNAMNR